MNLPMKSLSNYYSCLGLIIVLCLSFTTLAIAQDEKPEHKHGRHGGRFMGEEKLEAAKIGYLTTKLNLSESQAKDFWVIQNEYSKKRKEIFKQLRQLKNDADVETLTEDQADIALKKFLELREEEIELEKNYKKRFLKVISKVQLVRYFQAEQDFNRMLIKKLGKRENNNTPPPSPTDE